MAHPSLFLRYVRLSNLRQSLRGVQALRTRVTRDDDGRELTGHPGGGIHPSRRKGKAEERKSGSWRLEAREGVTPHPPRQVGAPSPHGEGWIFYFGAAGTTKCSHHIFRFPAVWWGDAESPHDGFGCEEQVSGAAACWGRALVAGDVLRACYRRNHANQRHHELRRTTLAVRQVGGRETNHRSRRQG